MNAVSCPTTVVAAPVQVVWSLLTHPERWGDFYDMRITAIDPAGPARVGQTIFAESGPRFLHLKVQIRFTEIEAQMYRLGLDLQLPFGVRVREDLTCCPVDENRCRVNYHCAFSFAAGARGTLTHLLMRHGSKSGPIDSLERLKGAAEQLHSGRQS